MHKLFSLGIIFFLVFGNLLSSFAEMTDISTYQLEFRDISLKEAQDVINRSIGSGSVKLKDGEDRLQRMKGPGGWFKGKDDTKILGGVPFYGPRGLVVAYEYYLQCGDTICGSIYDVAPGLTTTDQVMNLFVKGAKCIYMYECLERGNPVIESSYYTFFVPDANPVSLRLAQSIEKGQIKFYHGIYAIGLDDKKVISLDPRDEALTRKELKKRLVGLADFSMSSPTIPLIYERAKNGNDSFQCFMQKQSYERTMYVSGGPGINIPEIEIINPPRGTYYQPLCMGISGQNVLILGNHTLSYFGHFDLLAGRIFAITEPKSPADNYQNYPLEGYINWKDFIIKQ